MNIDAKWLGQIEYDKAWDLQKEMVAERVENPELGDEILLLEHPATYTLGRSGKLDHLLLSEEEWQEQGFTVRWVDRGGDITYHGPGQLIAYPIVDLEAARLNVDHYVELLEEIMIRTAREFDVDTQRNPLNRGIWMGNNKMGSIGIAIRKGVSFHGLALNVNLSLEPFTWINPCVLNQVGMTSIQKESKRDVSMQDARQAFINHFATVFEVGLVDAGLDEMERLIEI